MAQSKRLKAYTNHVARCRNKTDALGSPVEMRLTFEEWCQIWDLSGHWEERGNKSGQYCMSRVNDLGHYEAGNVFIQLHTQNTSQRTRFGDTTKSTRFKGKRHTAEHNQLMSEMNLGSKNRSAIIDETIVRNIKISLASGEKHRVLADRYGVAKPTISAIATGRNWKHVTI